MFTQEDLKPHRTAAVFLIRSNGDILVMHHKKHDMLAPVIGKAHDNEHVIDAAVREVKEEVGVELTVQDLSLFGTYKKQYDFAGTEVWIETFCYAATSWSGAPTNREPNKHSDLRFASADAILDEMISGKRVADALRFAIGLRVP